MFLYLLQIKCDGGHVSIPQPNSGVWRPSSCMLLYTVLLRFVFVSVVLLFDRLRTNCLNLASCSVEQDKVSTESVGIGIKRSADYHFKDAYKYRALKYTPMGVTSIRLRVGQRWFGSSEHVPGFFQLTTANLGTTNHYHHKFKRFCTSKNLVCISIYIYCIYIYIYIQKDYYNISYTYYVYIYNRSELWHHNIYICIYI